MYLKTLLVVLCFYLTYAHHDDEWIEQKDFPCWSKREKWHYKGLHKAPFYTLPSCLRYCISLEDCSAVDYDVKTDPPCWTQIPGQVIYIEKKMEKHRCDNYLLDRGCLEPRIVPYSIDMCWSQREFYSYKGLEPVKGVISVGACLNHCSAMDSCNTVDFDPASKEALCWVQKVEEINKDNFVESKTASNFLLNRECLALFDDDAVYNTELCWKRSENTHYKGLKSVNAMNIMDCLNMCADSDCEVADFDINVPKPCFIMDKKGPGDKSLFKKLDKCLNFVLDTKCFK